MNEFNVAPCEDVALIRWEDIMQHQHSVSLNILFVIDELSSVFPSQAGRYIMCGGAWLC